MGQRFRQSEQRKPVASARPVRPIPGMDEETISPLQLFRIAYEQSMQHGSAEVCHRLLAPLGFAGQRRQPQLSRPPGQGCSSCFLRQVSRRKDARDSKGIIGGGVASGDQRHRSAGEKHARQKFRRPGAHIGGMLAH